MSRPPVRRMSARRAIVCALAAVTLICALSLAAAKNGFLDERLRAGLTLWGVEVVPPDEAREQASPSRLIHLSPSPAWAGAYDPEGGEIRSPELPGMTLPERFGDGALDGQAAEWIINEMRAQAGLEPLDTTDEALREAADIRARELCQSYGVVRPDGSGYATVFTRGGLVVERRARGLSTANAAVLSWLGTAGSSILLDEDMDALAVSAALGEDGYVCWAAELWDIDKAENNDG